MLESMISNPRPTRAECSDVANAVLDGTDAVMLSGETANGAFPRDAVAIMARTCQQAEANLAESDETGYDQIFEQMKKTKRAKRVSLVESACSSAVKMATDIGSKAIIVLSETGETARLLAKYHPQAKIMAVCNDSRIANQIEGYMCNTLSILTQEKRGEGRHVKAGFKAGIAKGIFANGDAVVVVHTMRNGDGLKQWTVRILNVSETPLGN